MRRCIRPGHVAPSSKEPCYSSSSRLAWSGASAPSVLQRITVTGHSEESGPSRAADWLRRVYASIDDLEASPRATQDEGAFDGRELRSKLVISHRVFFTIGEAEQMVYVIDVVHTARQDGLDTYRNDQ